MRLLQKCILILLAVVIASSAAAREEVRVEDLFEYAKTPEAGAENGEGEGAEEPPAVEEVSAEKLGFKAFARDTAIAYTAIWAARFFYVRNKNSRIFDTSLSKWWNNISQWPVWDDGDSFFTNWVTHPIVGSQDYLFYRAMGHSRWVSALGVVVQSTLFEYTVEGLVETPSLVDLVSTPGVGVPMGILLEESSNWLVSTDFVPAKILGHILNPMRNFVHDRQIGVYNPFSKQFMSVSGPLEFAPGKPEAIDLAYPFFFEQPFPLGRFRADLEVVNLKKSMGNGEFIFYSLRIDVPSKSRLWGVYVQIAQSGINSLSIDGVGQRDGFEFANVLVGGKHILFKTHSSIVSAGLGLMLPTSYKDNVGRLQTLTLFRRNFPINLQKAWTVSPYLTAAAWSGPFNIQAMVQNDFVLNASQLEGNSFEYRINYSAVTGVNIPVIASPVLFAEFNGYSALTADTFKKTDLFVTTGVRLGRKYSPGFAMQFPLTGPDKSIDKYSYMFDFQVRF